MIYPPTPQFFEGMDPSDWASGLAVAVVAVVLLASGPLASGFLQPSGGPTSLGEGDATVADVTVPTEDLVITSGRFGTNVAYLRVPDARIDLSAVTDRPRLVYRIQVPALDADISATDIVTDRGTYRLHIRDHALESGTVSAGSYDATVTVRVQSFTADRTVYRQNVTVEVQR